MTYKGIRGQLIQPSKALITSGPWIPLVVDFMCHLSFFFKLGRIKVSQVLCSGDSLINTFGPYAKVSFYFIEVEITHICCIA